MKQEEYLKKTKRELNKRVKNYDEIKQLKARIRQLERKIDLLESIPSTPWITPTPVWPYYPLIWDSWISPIPYSPTVKIEPFGYPTTGSTAVAPL